MSAMLLDHVNSIATGAFSSASNPSLREIRATFISYDEPYNKSRLSTFWGRTSLSNADLTVCFMDGDIANGQFMPNDDPFMKTYVDG